MMQSSPKPWIGKPSMDIAFILLPPFVCLLIIALFPGFFANTSDMPDAGWVILILLIDVAHVYSTLYRTYFDPVAFRRQRTVLTTIPLLGFIGGVLLYTLSSLWFWRVLAYTAIYHFIRQQYGFMRLYSRKENASRLRQHSDSVIIYTATIYPMIYWHLSGPRHFNWFVDEDLLYTPMPGLLTGCTVVYFVTMAGYTLLTIANAVKRRVVNIPKLLLIYGTVCSWYFGIVYFNGDMAFTLLNVVSHGVPYMALVWWYGRKNYLGAGKGTSLLRLLFSKAGIPIFLAGLFLFAFIEEGLWDVAVWKEHGNIFKTSFWHVTVPDALLAFIVPLLALPQITHYILDGFIWRIRNEEIAWKRD